MSLPSWLLSDPIAHRGLYDAEEFAENSSAAFRHAIDLGVPFEFDVQLTSDGHPVVVHDRDLTRVVGSSTPPVSELDLHQTRQLPVAATGQPIPTLDDVLEVVNGTVPVVVDVRRWRASGDSGLEQAVAARLRRYSGEAAIQSFDPIAVHRLRKLLPERPVGQISGGLASVGPILRAIGRTMVTNLITRPQYIAYELSELPTTFVSFWRSRGLPVIGYTAHSDEEEHRAKDLADNVFFSGYLPRRYREAD
nr:glycerophosphodiester phosphodiesterase family protein [Kibdelosporangium sp. MJ126-NF4]CEL14572.1 Glycerophosphoryl diester phosphodiesterase [Kibdelosporangium sp. MJ126-NF4]CTQ88937.1 Glycerophosphoryl diester phosphodiesterase (EC 3.1.4.46) [Kibdelosporangium sp. MJ126-NF4]